MIKKATISALVLSIAIISAQSPAQASINPTRFENNPATMNFNLTTLDTSSLLEKTTALSPGASSVKVAWSIRGAAKKVGRGIKKTGRGIGRAAKGGGRFIRGAVSERVRLADRGVRMLGGVVVSGVDYAYGKRCKPNKYLQPVCKVGGKRTRVVTTHKHQANVPTHAHRR